MSWIRITVKTVYLLVLASVCGVGLYNLHVQCQHTTDTDKTGALALVDNTDQTDDGVVITEAEDEIENPEPFIPTKEWQIVKPGQAIPRGLHVRLNVQTGKKEARLMPEDVKHSGDAVETQGGASDKYNLDELKRAVKSMKAEKVKSVDMETLKSEHKLRSYEELKEELEKMNADVKTDAEVISELVSQFQALSPTQHDLTPILGELEFYLHQIDNAMLFCDLGAMPLLLHCLNNTMETVRAEAALTLGSAVQSNPKVQIVAIESGAIQELLRLITFDSSTMVRKRALFALSTMTRQFPFAQKRFLELGGLSTLAKLFDNKSEQSLQVKAVTLLADLVKEKSLHSKHSDPEDSHQEERLKQYEQIHLQEAMAETGWCSLIPSLLLLPDHDSREKVLVAMGIVIPECRSVFQESVPVLRNLHKEYKDLASQEQEEDVDFYQGIVAIVDSLLDELSLKDEL